ncbi:MAG: PD-(D/E)XK nuclease family protein, partial [Thermotogaceae bacterium]|nr:PD-(D/E)XK nuclease family protein [Thermotogaceae bacterium]
VDKEAMEKDLKKKRDDTAIGWLPQIVIGLYSEETGQLEEELEDLVAFVKAPALLESAEIGREGTAWEEPDEDYMKRFDHLKFRRIVSPTTLDFDDKQTEILEIDSIERTSRSSTAEGLYVHRIFELLGNPAGRPKGKRLNEILSDPELLRESAAPERAKEILEQLKELGHHEIIREIEDSEVCRSEVRFERAFDKFILAGVIDKLYKTSEGWKIVDFKLAEKRADMLERYKFQMEFYLYLLKNSLDPVSATILYLKDGDTETVTLQNTRDFEIRLENHVTHQTEEN